MSYKSDCSKQRHDGDSSLFHKPLEVDALSDTLSSSSDDLSPPPRRMQATNRGDGDGASGRSSDEDSVPSISSASTKQTQVEHARTELHRKRRHQQSDKQRRARITDGMKHLKALVSLHGRLRSSDQAGIVSASVELVHALMQEIAELETEVELTRGENALMKQREWAGHAGLDAVMCGPLGAFGQSPMGQFQRSQSSSLPALHSPLPSLNQQQVNSNKVNQQLPSGLNMFNNTTTLSSLGLPTTIGAKYTADRIASNHPQHHQQSSSQRQGLISPLPFMSPHSPSPFTMPLLDGDRRGAFCATLSEL